MDPSLSFDERNTRVCLNQHPRRCGDTHGGATPNHANIGSEMANNEQHENQQAYGRHLMNRWRNCDVTSGLPRFWQRIYQGLSILSETLNEPMSRCTREHRHYHSQDDPADHSSIGIGFLLLPVDSKHRVSKSTGVDPFRSQLHIFCFGAEPASLIQQFVDSSFAQSNSFNEFLCFQLQYRCVSMVRDPREDAA
jgi:hypothetical protein